MRPGVEGRVPPPGAFPGTHPLPSCLLLPRLTRSREGREELPGCPPLPRLDGSHTKPRKAREFFHAEPPRAPRVVITCD